jgi:hypothetical protein
VETVNCRSAGTAVGGTDVAGTASAGVAAAETGMASAEAGVATTAATMTSAAMLRPHGYSQQEPERRHGHHATHNCIIRRLDVRLCQFLFHLCAFPPRNPHWTGPKDNAPEERFICRDLQKSERKWPRRVTLDVVTAGGVVILSGGVSRREGPHGGGQFQCSGRGRGACMRLEHPHSR